jgi:hypothetical protein
MNKKKTAKIFTVLIVLAVAFYAGIDIVPGEWDHGAPSVNQLASDFSLRDLLNGRPEHVIRLRRADGRAISEAEEDKMIPMLESLDHALETGNSSHAHDIREQLKALHIYSDTEVDGILTREGITHILMQMEATVPLWRHGFRALVASIFIFQQDLVVSGHPLPALAIELLLQFSPYGHPVTTAGRHFDGGRTWLGLRRFDLGVVLILQTSTAFFLHYFGKIFLVNTLNVSTATVRCWGDHAYILFSLGTVVLFSWQAVDLYTSGPTGWIVSADGDSEAECAPEFTMEVALSMHRFYISLMGWDLASTVIDKFRTQLRPTSLDLPEPIKVATFLFGPTVATPSCHYWFWFLVLYFSPYEDAAVPMLVVCCCKAIEAVADCYESTGWYGWRKTRSITDNFLLPASTVVELAHWVTTVAAGCHWPVVLWLRVPALMQGAAVFLENVLYCFHGRTTNTAQQWVRANATKERIEVWLPGDDGQANLPAPLLASGAAPGRWTRSTAEVLMDVDPMSYSSGPRGAMREVYHLFDNNAKVFDEQSGQSGQSADLNYADRRKLVFKRYRGLGLEAEPEHVRKCEPRRADIGDDVYFRDAYMQHVANALAAMFSKANSHRVQLSFTPVAVIRALDRPGQPYYGVECFLTGSYKKWNNNHVFQEFLFADDAVPSAYCHYTHAVTEHKLLVCDIQGVKAAARSYILTDPQIHSVEDAAPTATKQKTGVYGEGDKGGVGMKNFYVGHHCSSVCKHLGLVVPEKYRILAEEAKRKLQKEKKVLSGKDIADALAEQVKKAL